MTKSFPLSALALLAPAALLVSCASPKSDANRAAVPARVWPSPPDAPRIRYIRSVSTPADVGRSPSIWKRMGRFFTGEAGERESLNKPFAVALDETGNLCVTDTGNNTVCYCDFVRKEWRRWDAVGKTHFEAPVAIARRNGIFYVADSQLGKIFAFDDKGRGAFEIGAPLQRPAGLAIAGDALAVVDSQAHAVFVFDLRGHLRFQFGRRGAAPGEFNFPTHIAADSQGHWLVTDALNSRIQVFAADGKVLSEIGSSGDTPGHFGRPKGVAADTFGHIYVADAVFDNIQIFDLSGRLLLNLGEGGTGPGEFGLPAGIAIGADNRIYVADSYNRRVQVFQYLGQQ
jgi:sugar lactone lactonase YvrE